jgi:hypothetical protein
MHSPASHADFPQKEEVLDRQTPSWTVLGVKASGMCCLVCGEASLDHLIAIICVSPHGSNIDGTSTTSAPA